LACLEKFDAKAKIASKDAIIASKMNDKLPYNAMVDSLTQEMEKPVLEVASSKKISC
jgi:hypothetical protein